MSSGNDADVRIAISDQPLAADTLTAWAVVPGCGAVVSFLGTVRDHAEGRDGVVALEYEAYEGPALDRLRGVADEARVRWPELGRIALVHRVGLLEVGDAAVVVVVSAPHRAAAFAAASWAIDTLKQTVPIWKKEHWRDGSGWGTAAVPLTEVGRA